MNRLKDQKPFETISLVRSILSDLGIFVTESWIESGVSCIFSVRIEIAGTRVGTNGKGGSRLLALASAYGEFMERLSNGVLFRHLGKDLFPHYLNAKKLDFESVAQGNILLDTILFEMLGAKENAKLGLDSPAQFDDFPAERERRLGCWGLERGSKCLALPYVGLLSDSEGDLPVPFIHHYGSHGMAAGNTHREAIVQAVSEILERYCQAQIYTERLTPPVISRDVLEKYFPDICRIVDEIEERGDYCLEIRDCSLGRGFPVYCACLSSRTAQRFALTFGSSPNPATALERLLTETLQGRTLSTAASCKFGSPMRPAPFELRRLFKNSTGSYPAEFWDKKSSWEVDTETLLHNCADNVEALSWFSLMMQREGMDIFVRDTSVFGFPSVHVIIPGLSEVMGCDPFFLNYLSARNKARNVMKSLSSCSGEERAFLVEFVDFCRKMSTYDSPPFSRIKGWPGIGSLESIFHFLAVGYAELKQYREASRFYQELSKQVPTHLVTSVECLADKYALLAENPECDTHALLQRFYQKSSMQLADEMQEWSLSNFICDDEYPAPEHSIKFERMLNMAANYQPCNFRGFV